MRFKLVQVRKEFILDNRPGKPDAVIQFEDQKDIDGLPDCEAGTKDLTIVYYVEHYIILSPVNKAGRYAIKIGWLYVYAPAAGWCEAN